VDKVLEVLALRLQDTFDVFRPPFRKCKVHVRDTFRIDVIYDRATLLYMARQTFYSAPWSLFMRDTTAINDQLIPSALGTFHETGVQFPGHPCPTHRFSSRLAWLRTPDTNSGFCILKMQHLPSGALHSFVGFRSLCLIRPFILLMSRLKGYSPSRDEPKWCPKAR
jgi:hypothetical protein